MCVHVCVCVRERERESVNVFVCVLMCVYVQFLSHRKFFIKKIYVVLFKVKIAMCIRSR